MIIIMRPNASDEAVRKVANLTESKGLTTHLPKSSQATIVGVAGDKTKLLDTNIEISEGADKVIAITGSYKLVNKKLHSEDFVIPIGNTYIGPGIMIVMAGSCTIEPLSQLLETAYVAKKAGATFLCGGAYKPRTFPYSFQELEEEGLRYMKAAREAMGLNVTYEITSTHAIEPAMRYVDMLQTGARSMQNFELLREAGKSGIPILSERGLCVTTDEWLNAAEYITSEGNPNIVLCKRGIRTYEVSTRNTLDVNAVSVIHQKSHLSIIMDPSYAIDARVYVESLTKAVIVVGTDGLMIEVHSCSAKTLSDDPQSLTFDTFEQLMKDLAPYAELSGRTLKAQ